MTKFIALKVLIVCTLFTPVASAITLENSLLRINRQMAESRQNLGIFKAPHCDDQDYGLWLRCQLSQAQAKR